MGGILEKGGRSRKGGVWSPLPTMIQIDELMELYLIFTWKLILCFLSKSDSIWNLKQYENSNHLVLIPSHYLFVLRKNLKEFFCLCWNGAWYKKLYGPFLWLGSTVSRLQIHYEETIYFLTFSFQEFLVLNWSTSEGWNTKLILEQPVVLKLHGLIFCRS